MPTEDELLIDDITLLMEFDKDPELILARALTYRRLLRFRDAVEDFDRLIRQGFEEAYKFRGECFLKQGFVDHAEADLGRYLAMAPDDAFTLRHSGEIYRLREEWQKASFLFSQSLVHEPDNLFALSGLAECRRAADDLDGALRLYDLVLNADPFHSQALAGRAAIFQARGDRDAATREFRVAMMEDPTNEFAEQGLKDSLAMESEGDSA